MSGNGLRFNPSAKFRDTAHNQYFFGLIELISTIRNLKMQGGLNMIEIGSYMGESTAIFAMSGIFNSIHCIDPWEGEEESNNEGNRTWEAVRTEFETNTRQWRHGFHPKVWEYKNYSHKCHHLWPDNSVDFIYIDGNHSYESVKQDIELYLPKLKKGGIIAGHDYKFLNIDNRGNWATIDSQFPGTIKAIDEVLGGVDFNFSDSSWAKVIK
jgi:hypothetical protein